MILSAVRAGETLPERAFQKSTKKVKIALDKSRIP